MNKNELILQCSEIPLYHWVLEISGFKIKLNVNQSFPEPEIFIRDSVAFIAIEQGVFSLDIHSHRLISEISEVTNVQWIENDCDNSVIIIAEDEVIALNNHGKLSWRKNMPDLIETTNIINDSLFITDMSGQKYSFDILTGRIIAN